ncbi:MAG TPA: hypothetical protein VEA69_21750, partial [Tepidisphaeraceae bacterium]|nr:hypothetical protein [Tepidisphaeraceae bacterium]
PDNLTVRSHRGDLVLLFSAHPIRTPNAPWPVQTGAVLDYTRDVALVNKASTWKVMGVEGIGLTSDADFAAVLVPFYYVVVPLLGLSVWSVAAWRGARDRAMPGHCAGCGYDLRGSIGRCPECGLDGGVPGAAGDGLPRARVGT